MINKKRLISTFKQLVRLDSLSLYERKVYNFLRQELKKLGVHSFEAGRTRIGEVGNLAAILPGCGANSPCLLFNAHIDTVSPGRRIKPIEKNGLIRSDGTTILGADNKAGVAAILEIIRTLKEKKLPHPPLRVLFTVAEEIGLEGAKVVPAKFLKADYGLILDGGDIDQVINKAPSQYNLEATIIGRAAHAGLHPEEGINAIKVASEAIAKMKLGRIDHETTANIGIISGGQATNIVPDEVKVRGEARSHDRRKLDRQVEHMERVLLRACQKRRARLKLKVERAYRSFEIKKDNKIFASIIRGMKAAGLKPTIAQTGGGSDANIFNERGIPSIIFGLGADHVHTTSEQIKIEDLGRGTEAVLNIILEMAKWKGSKKN